MPPPGSIRLPKAAKAPLKIHPLARLPLAAIVKELGERLGGGLGLGGPLLCPRRGLGAPFYVPRGLEGVWGPLSMPRGGFGVPLLCPEGGLGAPFCPPWGFWGPLSNPMAFLGAPSVSLGG